METLSEKKLRPTIGGSLGFAWNRMFKSFLPLLLVVLIMIAVQLPTGAMNFGRPSVTSGAFFTLYSLLVISVFYYGAAFFFLKVVRDEYPPVDVVISGFKNYLNVVLANLLYGVLVLIGICLLIIPGIVLSVRLVFVPFMVMDKGMDPVEAIKGSWELTKGYGWTIFGLVLVSIPIAFVGLLLLGIGIIPAMIWIYLAFAALYQAILEKKEAVEVTPAI